MDSDHDDESAGGCLISGHLSCKLLVDNVKHGDGRLAPGLDENGGETPILVFQICKIRQYACYMQPPFQIKKIKI